MNLLLLILQVFSNEHLHFISALLAHGKDKNRTRVSGAAAKEAYKLVQKRDILRTKVLIERHLKFNGVFLLQMGLDWLDFACSLRDKLVTDLLSHSGMA